MKKKIKVLFFNFIFRDRSDSPKKTSHFLVRYINFTNTSFHFVGSRRENIDCSSKAVVRDAFPESRVPGQSKTHLYNHPISSCYLPLSQTSSTLALTHLDEVSSGLARMCYLRVRKQNGLPAKIRSLDLVFSLFKAIFDSAA